MLIISSHRDYYDTVMRQGIDRSVVYQRKQTSIVSPLDKPLLNFGQYNREDGLGHIIGFCGQVWPVVVMRHDQAVCYSKEEVDKFLERTKLRGEIYGPPGPKLWRKSIWRVEVQVENFFKADYSRLQGIFQAHKCPVFVLTGGTVILNGRLKGLNFQRIKDPFTAFQEIQGYLSGVLGQSGRPIPKVPDEIRAEAHGFDKFSFRKDKKSKS